MSEGGASWSFGWVSSLVKQSQEFAQELAQEINKDLHEFVDVVKEDTLKQKEVIEKRIETLQPTVTSSVSNLISSLISDSPQETKQSVFFDRKQADLDALRKDISTYCVDPTLTSEWESFRKTFRISEKTEEISKLLTDYPEILAIHTRLVPATVSHDLFWQRYFFKVEKLEQDQQRRKKVFEARTTEEEEILWDQDDETSEEQPQEKGKKKVEVETVSENGEPKATRDGSINSIKEEKIFKESEKLTDNEETLSGEEKPKVSSEESDHKKEGSESSYELVQEKHEAMGDDEFNEALNEVEESEPGWGSDWD